MAVQHADLIVAKSVTPLGTDLVRRHRPRVVDRRALAEVVDATDKLSCFDVALSDEVLHKQVSASFVWPH